MKSEKSQFLKDNSESGVVTADFNEVSIAVLGCTVRSFFSLVDANILETHVSPFRLFRIYTVNKAT